MINPEFNGMTLEDAQAWLRERVDDGATCPCCTQFAKVYRRKVHATMARALIHMWQAGGTIEFVNIANLRVRGGGDETKLRYWNLIEPDPDNEAMWRVTSHGEAFVHNTVTIPKYARVYDGRCLRVEGEDVSIVDALGTRFVYADLMRGV